MIDLHLFCSTCPSSSLVNPPWHSALDHYSSIDLCHRTPNGLYFKVVSLLAMITFLIWNANPPEWYMWDNHFERRKQNLFSFSFLPLKNCVNLFLWAQQEGYPCHDLTIIILTDYPAVTSGVRGNKSKAPDGKFSKETLHKSDFSLFPSWIPYWMTWSPQLHSRKSMLY